MLCIGFVKVNVAKNEIEFNPVYFAEFQMVYTTYYTVGEFRLNSFVN